MTNRVFKELNLPPARLNLFQAADGSHKVYDFLRNRTITLTPEEWVRQHFTHYLVDTLGYPAGLMANEVSLSLNGTQRRCDTLVYDRNAVPVMLIEYKAPSVNITQEVFDQIVRYNMVLKVRFLAVSNGMNHYCCEVRYNPPGYKFLENIPTYENIIK
ncbi:MAG: type I restriction enzyme HsdR N-terminal domain-containing protein [Muribaculaceae bacterium]|nr:type I restriction enzyme HsdR N-terminal domain-containing protein [Muribaculaceae bacterium]